MYVFFNIYKLFYKLVYLYYTLVSLRKFTYSQPSYLSIHLNMDEQTCNFDVTINVSPSVR